ncbi:MAG: endo-1,4-beta-xylanase [Phycisphaerales bacterium]|nr:MAG: endo-1,4-beta-xylanase [Phycisphaerales bacterium]
MRTQRWNLPRPVWTRRRLLKAGGAGIAGLAASPYVVTAQRQAPSQTDEEVLAQAEARIQQHRTGPVTLKLFGPDRQVLPPGTAVKIRLSRHRFLFGCNIFKLNRCRSLQDNIAYGKRFANLLNFATLPFYWWNYERQKGQPQDERTEEIVQWCKAHAVTTKGHPLAWNYVDPPWLEGSAQEVMDLQMQRIERCVRRFRGDIDIWDVVNEATHYDRDQCKKRSPKLTAAMAQAGIGPYVRAAFERARQANPEATLLINDYRTDPAYPDKVISELVDEQKKPLYDVIGIQSHMHGGFWGAARAWDVCERFARFGKPLHFTETTVVSGPREGSQWVTTAEGERRQAESVRQFYTALFSHPAVEALTWWDFTDQNAWQGAPAGLLRDDMSPKPAYDVLHELIKGQWSTQTEVKTAADGQLSLHGFFGSYQVTVRHSSRQLRGSFVLEPDTTETVAVALS